MPKSRRVFLVINAIIFLISFAPQSANAAALTPSDLLPINVSDAESHDEDISSAPVIREEPNFDIHSMLETSIENIAILGHMMIDVSQVRHYSANQSEEQIVYLRNAQVARNSLANLCHVVREAMANSENGMRIASHTTNLALDYFELLLHSGKDAKYILRAIDSIDEVGLVFRKLSDDFGMISTSFEEFSRVTRDTWDGDSYKTLKFLQNYNDNMDAIAYNFDCLQDEWLNLAKYLQDLSETGTWLYYMARENGKESLNANELDQEIDIWTRQMELMIQLSSEYHKLSSTHITKLVAEFDRFLLLSPDQALNESMNWARMVSETVMAVRAAQVGA